MYRIRIEHDGYDSGPLTFNSTLSLAEYLSWVARAEEFDGTIYFSLKLIEDKDNE